MKYFFILGNNPALSVAEIRAIYPDKAGEFLQPDVFLLDADIDPEPLIKRLGGTIKIGSIIKNITKDNQKKIKEEMLELAQKKVKTSDGKFKFGISCYGKCGIKAKDIGIDIKKVLKEEGLSVRFVTSREKTLSSVVVTQNKLDTRGLEIILISNGNEVLVGATEAVQDFKGLSFRDYGRPARDDESGMIPPKLAQIMLNLSGKIDKSPVILDPFCGSGTILMEASLMDVNNLVGADASPKAITGTQANLDWLAGKYPNLKSPISNLQLFKTSAIEISNKLAKNSIDLIITEPYLGPQKGLPDVDKTARELNELYSESLNEFKKVLKKDGVIVMIWPIFIRGGQKYFLSPDISGYKIKNPLKNIKGLSATDRGTLIYGREGQKVWREIVALKRKL